MDRRWREEGRTYTSLSFQALSKVNRRIRISTKYFFFQKDELNNCQKYVQCFWVSILNTCETGWVQYLFSSIDCGKCSFIFSVLEIKGLEGNEVFRVTICFSFDLLFPFILMHQFKCVLDHQLYCDEIILKYLLKLRTQTLAMKHEKC